MRRNMIGIAAALAVMAAFDASAQASSQTRIRVRKDATTGTAAGVLVVPADTAVVVVAPIMPADTVVVVEEWYTAVPATCSAVNRAEATAVAIKTNLYDPATMIAPDTAKVIALCAVPGQIGSGEMNVADGRIHYAIDIIPNHKKTHTKVLVDAQTGAVLSSKQFGGLRGKAGWIRESFEHKENKAKAKKP